jgi:RNA polymerase sigma-70 factor (ECF subfamily)
MFRDKKDFDSDFINLYKWLFPGIYRFVFRLIGNEAEAEQISQQTFTKLYSYFKSNYSIKIQKALVYRIAHQLCIDVLRERKLEIKINKSERFKNQTIVNPQDNYIRNQQISIIRNALQKLASRDQRCVLLYQEGYSYAEIAEISKINKNSVGQILSRATNKLAQIIKKGEIQ